MRAGRQLAGHALLRAAGWLALLVATAAAVTAIDSGGRLPWRAALAMLGPLALAVGTAGGAAALRRRGDWRGWSALGVGAERALPLAVLAAALGATAMAPSPVPPELALPAPLAPDTLLVRDGGRWVSVDAEPWTVPPGELALPRLIDRAQEAAPPGARPTDRAELARRGGLALLWLLAVPWGLRQGRHTTPPLRAEAGAAVGLAVAAVAGLVGVAYLAIT